METSNWNAIQPPIPMPLLIVLFDGKFFWWKYARNAAAIMFMGRVCGKQLSGWREKPQHARGFQFFREKSLQH
jgi:hypothetical protein